MNLKFCVIFLFSLSGCKAIDGLLPIKRLIYDVSLEKEQDVFILLNPKKIKFRIKICNQDGYCQSDYFSSQKYPIGKNTARIELSECSVVGKTIKCSDKIQVIELKDSGLQPIILNAY